MGIRVADVAFVRFAAPDLDEMESFLVDFGLVRSERTADTLFMRGVDDEGFVHVTHLAEAPAFLGFAFDAESVDDLETLSARDDVSPVFDLEGPGGGRTVRLTDPDGFEIEVVAGRGSVGALGLGRSLVHNDARSRSRLGEPLRVSAGPSQVKRLGHVVLNVTDFAVSQSWYKEWFGLITSDEIVLDEQRSLGAFLRCDRGERFVDHHTLFLIGAGSPSFNHAAFEVVNVDDLMAGHTHLGDRDRRHHWGVGRHVLGSQVYDYWCDPWGQVVEHWTDGDLFDASTPPGRAGLSELMGSQWGPTHTRP